MPSTPDSALVAEGMALFNAGRHAAARDRFARAAKTRPDAACFLGHALQSLGRPADAVRAFAQAVVDFPAHAPAREGLSGVLLWALQHPEAAAVDAESLERARRALAGTGARRGLCRLHLLRARAAKAGGRWKEAGREIAAALSAAPGDADAELFLRDLAADPSGETLKLFEELHRSRPAAAAAAKGLAELRLAKAEAARAAADPRAALKFCAAGLAADPASQRARRLALELLRETEGTPALASEREAARQALRARPRSLPRPRTARGGEPATLRDSARDWAKRGIASRELARARRRLPRLAAPALLDLYLSAASVGRDAGRWEDSLRCAYQALALEPANAEAGVCARDAVKGLAGARDLAAALRRARALAPGGPGGAAARRALAEAKREWAEEGRAALRDLARDWAKRGIASRELARAEKKMSLSISERIDLHLWAAADGRDAGRWLDALRCAFRALALDPANAEGSGYARDAVKGLAGDGDRVPALLRAAALAPGGRGGAAARAALAEAARQWAEEAQRAARSDLAESLCRAGVKVLGAEGANLRLNLAESLLQRGRSDDAKAALAPLRRSPSPVFRFRAAMLSGDFRGAFADAERLVDDGSARAREVLEWPWGMVYPDIGAAKDAFRGIVTALSRLSRARGGGPWPRFYLGVAMRRCGMADYLEELKPLLSVPAARYCWMRFEVGRSMMHCKEYRGALKAFESLLATRGAQAWRCRAYRGETFALLGRPKDAVAEFGRALAAAPAEERVDALAWRGSVRLWLGDAAGALRDLDEAAKGGARYAFAWRGAAKIAAGRAKDALPDLDRALALKPWDLEALVWRGEVRRRLGRRAQALEDLNAAVELTQNAWPLCHRALVHADAGDDAALLADFEEISSSTGAVFVPPLLARLRLKPSPVSPALARKVLRAMAALNHADCRSYELAFKYR